MRQQYIEEDMQKHIQNMEVGDRIVTKSRVITKTDLELYAISTGDIHPMFLSEEYAKEFGWRTQLVPGLLAFSIAVGLLIQSGFIADVIAFMGTDKVRFNAPVYPYDTIRVKAEVLSKKETKKGNWICTYKWVIRNQSDEAVAEGENMCMFKPR
jgi:oxepin-CoA hydrolase/3-oxo-5,6-dehydrosuberyl-CoA semialdehyde dehydrogenase